MKHSKYIVLYYALFSFNSLSQDFWRQAEFPAFVESSIADLSSKDQICLAAAYTNGLVLSTNSGEHWFSVGQIMSGEVAISNNGYLFAAGINGNLYRSTDIGNTWQEYQGLTLAQGSKIIVSPNGYLYFASYQAVFRSTNFGDTWAEQNNGLVMGGESPSPRLNISKSGILILATPSGLFKSTNNAESWSRVSFFSATRVAINSLGHIFANKYRYNPYLNIDSLYRSTDNGISWQPLRWWSGMIFIDPISEAIVTANYSYTQNYFISYDNGNTWSTVPFEVAPSVISYNGNGTYFQLVEGLGIFKSNSIGGPWQPCNKGFPGGVTKITSILYQNRALYTATEKFGLYLSSNDGLTFGKLFPGLSSSKKIVNTSNGYLFSIGTFLSRSTTSGISWIDLAQIGTGLYNFVTYGICSKDSLVVVSGCDYTGSHFPGKIMRSINNGDTWFKVLEIPLSSLDEIGNTVVSLAMNQNGTMLGCVENMKVYHGHTTTYTFKYSIIRSTDYGLTWNLVGEVPANLPVIYDFAWNSNNSVFAVTSKGILKSTDNGLSWFYPVGSITQYDVKCIAVNSNDYIYVGTGNAGCLFSTNDGYSWETRNQGMTDTLINTMYISSNGFLYAGTRNKGVFRSVLPITSVEETNQYLPQNFMLYQNYPNPFNPSTKISWQSPVSSWQTLKVFDVLGNEVAALVDENKPAGSYEVEFNASSGIRNLSSGIYMYQLRAGEFVQTKKMILIR